MGVDEVEKFQEKKAKTWREEQDERDAKIKAEQREGKEKYIPKYNRNMIAWGTLNLTAIIIGLVGYLYYNPLSIEPDDFFGSLFVLGLASSICQFLLGILLSPSGLYG